MNKVKAFLRAIVPTKPLLLGVFFTFTGIIILFGIVELVFLVTTLALGELWGSIIIAATSILMLGLTFLGDDISCRYRKFLKEYED